MKQRPTKPYQQHQARPITTQWIAEAKEAMVRLKKSQDDIAEVCGCSQGAVSKTLRTPKSVSKIVVPMSKMLGIELPPLVNVSATSRELLDLLEEMDENGQRAVLDHAVLVLRSKQK